MENITTRNNIITDLEQYIDEGPFFDPETKKQEFWLHNLPENEDLFNIIELLREKYYNENFIFIINQKIEIKKITINRNIDLSNCVFKHEVYFENDKKIFLDSIHFHKTIFNSNITFFYSKFYLANFKDIDLQGNEYITFAKCSLEKVEFHNVNFRGNIQFDQSEMKDVSFKNCTFKGNTDFRKVSFKGKSEFLNCTFDSSEDNSTEMVNFSNSTFEQEANFSGSIFNLKADFSETIFGIEKEGNNSEKSSSEVKFLIENAKFQKEVDFSKAIFYDAIYFSGTEFCTDIEDYAKKSINFENAQFKRKVRFHHCKFYNTVRFENTSFNKLVDFYCAHFYKPQQFHFTDFLDRAIFSNTEFDKEIQFLHCRVESNSYIRFESANFKKGLDISRSNFNDKVNFWNIEIEEGDIFIFSKYEDDFEVLKNKINSKKTVPSVYKQLCETYRIIKDNSHKQNNKIEALEFSKKEMLVYERELKSVSSKSNNDKLLLLANKISNNFGTNWLRGILFTASAGIITYLLMLCCLPFIHNTYIFILFTSIIIIISAFSFLNKDIDSFLPILILIILSFLLTIILFKSPFVYKENICIKDYIIPDFIKILNVIDLKPFEKEENSIFNLSGLSYLFLFIGRIFIGYGYYQTIQAFRKFGKS